jgi:predicted TIM-barrel fold metal-dependent hydrolase
MIVDFHYHFAPRALSETAARQRAEKQLIIWGRSARSKDKRSIEELTRDRIAMSDDPNGEKLLERMEIAGIDITVAFPLDNISLGLDDDTVLADNRACAKMAERSNGKVIGFASIDPRRKNANRLFQTCIEEYGLKGLKWHPDNGYSPCSRESYNVLEVAQRLKVPLVTHTGCMYGNSKATYSHPLLLDDVAADLPELTIVAAHCGHLLWRDWCASVYFKRNIYGDLAEWAIIAAGNYEYFCRFLREAMDIVGSDRIVFATDGPGLELVVSNKAWIEQIKKLPIEAPAGIKFTEEEIASILGGNAWKILSPLLDK